MSEGCVFCDRSWMRAAEIFIETSRCMFVSTRDPGIRARAGLAEGVLPGSGAIVPIVHRTSVFDLTPAEWADTRDLLLQARMALHDLLAPDGYLLGWNQGGVLHPPGTCRRSGWCCSFRGRLGPFSGTVTRPQVADLG
jgi:diadenosine tetraphosphate (Ap4A) HIT family hydrolase